MPDALDPAVLDAADPLRDARGLFAFPDPGLVYLDGNSLGRPPLAALERVDRVAREEWSGELVRAWDHWLDLPLRIGDALAAGVLGAAPGTVAVTDSTTVNLHRLAAAALDDRPGRRGIVASRHDFPTDRYVLEGLARARGLELRWLDPDPMTGPTPAEVADALRDDGALVLLSLVDYRTAAIADMAGIEEAARAAGAHALWDLSHAAGVLPVDLDARGIGLAVGCTYKFLHGGPGAPAFLHVRSDLQARLRPPFGGWFAQRDQFAMGPTFDPAPGIAGWLVGTPPILSLVGVEEGARVVASAGVEAVRAKSVALTTYAIDLLDAELAPLGCSLGSPRDPARRAGHVAIRHARARELTTRLLARGVVPDFREPDVIRFGLAPLTTTFADVRRGVDTLRELLLDASGTIVPDVPATGDAR
jgi:kynureninase